MNLKVVKEVEIPSVPMGAAQPVAQERTAQRSGNSSDHSHLLAAMEMLSEARKILNARSSVILALAAAAALTYLAMDKGTGMALSIAISFDLFVFLPLAYIAYLWRKKE